MNGAFFFLFACFWSAFVLVFDGGIGRNLWKQYASQNYPTTTAQITHSEMTRHRGSKGGTSYGVDIRYRYAVDDRPFDGRQFRYSANSSSDLAWAQKAVAEHPVGSETR